MGFKDFCSQQEKKCAKTQNFNNVDVEEVFNKYKDLEQDQLIKELYKNIEKQKNDGTYNYEKICEMVEKMTPFLSKEQALKIRQLLKEIK